MIVVGFTALTVLVAVLTMPIWIGPAFSLIVAMATRPIIGQSSMRSEEWRGEANGEDEGAGNSQQDLPVSTEPCGPITEDSPDLRFWRGRTPSEAGNPPWSIQVTGTCQGPPPGGPRSS